MFHALSDNWVSPLVSCFDGEASYGVHTDASHPRNRFTEPYLPFVRRASHACMRIAARSATSATLSGVIENWRTF